MASRVAFRVPVPSGKWVGSFLALWLLVGFASGTATLLGPIRWLTDAGRAGGWNPQTESLLVKAVIGLFVMASFAASWFLARRAATGRRPALVVFGTAAAFSAAALWLWMTPALVNQFGAVEVTSLASFSFGPYPDEARFETLRDEGYTAVVSLLHPAVLPFEPRLLARERILAEQYGLELIHAPMLPWVSDNQEAIAQVRELARSGTGRYYVHCYLGRDRVGMIRALVGREMEGADMAATAEAIRELEGRRAFVAGRFERGPIHKLDEGVYFTPYPTDEEFLAYVLSGAFRQVVSLLDPDNPEDLAWIDREREMLEGLEIPFSLMPVAGATPGPAAVQAAVRAVKRLPRPVLIHAFLSEGTVTEAFVSSYRTGLPPVSASLFSEPMAGGASNRIAVNIATGPRPAGPEFGTRLQRSGVRGVVFVGPEDHRVATEDRVVVQSETDLTWQSFEPNDPSLLGLLGAGGPWYLYGPGLGVVQSSIQEQFSPTLASMQGTPSPSRGQ